jgi:formate dehydrogenase major subunit/formate dehydrogenase alpha subunit
MEKKNIIIINGQEFLFNPGETILSVARRNNVDIPTLCHLKSATPTGACRICVVEVDGARSLMRSEERRVGKECRRLCRSRWSPYH